MGHVVFLQSKSLHKEQLVMSETEKAIRRRVEQKAVQNQRRKTDEIERAQQAAKGSPSKVSHIYVLGQKICI